MDKLANPFERTFRASNIIQMVLIIFLWIVLGAVSVAYLFEVIALNLLILYWVTILLLTIWNRSLKLTIMQSGITFFSGFKERRLIWTEINAVSSSYNSWGFGGENSFTIHPKNNTKAGISFNITYFRYKDLAEVVLAIVKHVPEVHLDESTVKLLNRYSSADRKI